MSDQTKLTITLQYPVEYGGVIYSQLVMRRCKGRDLKLARKQAGGDEAEMDSYLMGNLCDVSVDVIDELDMVDFRSVQDGLRNFLGMSLTPAT